MARSGAGVYSKPAGTTPANGDDIDAPQFNTLMDDIAADLNVPRPIVAGGTGASTAATALAALGGAAKAANLSDLASIPTARTNLGLVPQTSVTDATVGSLLTVGGFGLGVIGTSPLLADLDAVGVASGEYRYNPATTGTFPAGVTAATGGLLDMNRLDSTNGLQTISPAGQDSVFFRRLATTFQAWQSFVSVLASTIADGDTIARISGAWARVAKGTAGQVYRQNDALTAPVWSDGIISTPAQATTSGTAFDFLAIPAWVKRVTVIGTNISLSGTDYVLIQLGTSGGFVTTGYNAHQSTIFGTSCNSFGSSAGFPMGWNGSGASVGSWTARFMRSGPGSNEWVHENNGAVVGGGTTQGGGSISLGAALTQIRVTRTGTNTFDAGSVTISYE